MPRVYLMRFADEAWAYCGRTKEEAAYLLREYLVERLDMLEESEPARLEVQRRTATAEEIETNQDW